MMDRKEFAEWLDNGITLNSTILNDFIDALRQLKPWEQPLTGEVVECTLDLISDEAFEKIKKMYEVK